ncbi:MULTISPECIES: hypothetical protein [unclassified Nostoc]|uniref:beta strand repeat-containing protein n=1 Tax=unclassified Nostoc TaxID=2593658 RepID=UPI002AD31006|nr:hypothetical protein [Nostoc sp. DedQUE03]MDZ7976724.1 hypothetical protein [Nostoc sp. DedQUE03]MDZ8047799.1 hypothetical protein [Nostoc sp. DedQUE02]
MNNLWKNFNLFGWGLIGATLILKPTQAQAQYIQRSFLNPGFESPAFGSTNQQCYVQVNENLIPGWSTTHGSVKAGTGNCTGYTSPGSVPLIEIWTTGFNSVSTATTPTSAGRQFAELNAEQASELYQNLCLLKDETITFSFLHRGRSSSTVADVANFLIGLITDPTPTVFGKFSTTSNGTVTAQPVAQNGATIPTVTNNNAGNGWVRYTGTVPYTGTTGNKPVGFAAVSTAGGNNTIGNFLDEVQFAGKPVVEFTASSGGAAESETNPTTNPPKLRIVGLVPTGGISVPISVSGTAILGTDYNTTSGTSTFNITIPAGNYDGSDATSVFTIPFTVINNNVPQGVRTIVFTIETSTSFFASSTTTCGGSPTVVSNYTIYDDDFLSGKVWNDVDNSANGTFNNINTGLEIGTNAGGLLNAILVDSNNKVLKSTSVAADGTYTFLDVPLNQSNVKIILSTTAGTVGNTAPTASLPATWVNTSPLTTATFNTGTSISSKDFGIKQQTINISGTVFSDADADVSINGSDAGTNAGSANLTIYAVDTKGIVLDKATVAANGTYSFTNVPVNSSVKLRLTNDSTLAIGATAPISPSLPSGWYHTGKNLNGTIDAAIATLGDIALTTTTSNVINQNFGIRQSYTITADAAPTICSPDYRTALNTGISATGGQLAVGANDLNWTTQWIAGPASGTGTPYATPRPVGPMPAVVVGKLDGAWVNEPTNARWISYPFRLSTNINGKHTDADLDGINGEDGSGVPISGTSDAVRLKFTSNLTLPSNANTSSISLPVGVAIDNQFVSIKVNGVENLLPTPTANSQAADYGTLKSVNITNGWQAGVNTIEIIMDSGPPLAGFFLSVQATTTLTCSNPNVLLVKRITAINGGTTTVGGDSLVGYIDAPTNPYDDNNITIPTQPTPTDPPKDTDKWPALNSFMIGGIYGGNVKPGDEMEYTIYFLSAGDGTAPKVLICDRVPNNVSFIPTAFNSFSTKNSAGLPSADRGIIWQHNGNTESLTNTQDGDVAQYFPAGVEPSTVYNDPINPSKKVVDCGGANTNGAIVVNLGDLPNATGSGTPLTSYGFIRFRGRVK